MKKIFIILAIAFGCFGILEAQNIWKPIEMQFPNLIGVNAQGDLFCRNGDNYPPSLQRSQDEGETWETVFTGNFGSCIVGNKGRMFLICDGIINYSDDSGDTWQQGTNACPFNSLEMYSPSNDTLVGYSTPYLTWTLDGGVTWDSTRIAFMEDHQEISDLLVNKEGDVYVSIWYYNGPNIGIYHSFLSDMRNWELVAFENIGVKDMEFDPEGNVICGVSFGGQFSGFENTPGFYAFWGNSIGIANSGIVYKWNEAENNTAVLAYSLNHGEHFTEIGERLPLSEPAPGGEDGFLTKGLDNHLYFFGNGQYWKSVFNANQIINAGWYFNKGWREITTGVTENLYGMACLSKDEIVVCGENGKILKTIDGGNSWSVKFEKEGYDMIHIAFADEQVGYACGDSSYAIQGIIVKTTDGGQTWQELPNTGFFFDFDYPDPEHNSDLYVVDAETFFIYTNGFNGLILKTSDGGQSFTYTNSNMGHFYQCEFYFEDEIGYLVGVGASGWDQRGLFVLKTTDAGETWNQKYFINTDGYSVITHFYDKNHIEILSNFNNELPRIILVTEDGFENVDYRTEGFYLGNVTHAKFTSDNYGCIIDGSTLMKGSTIWDAYIMENGWENLVLVNYGLPHCEYQGTIQCKDIYDIDGVDATFYMVSENGIVYKSATIPAGENTLPFASEWYYEIEWDDGSITYQHLECVGDTLFDRAGKRPKVIVRSNTHYDRDTIIEVTHEYVYEENGIIYWWNRELQEFTTLYNLVANVGDEWEINVGNESLTMHVETIEDYEYEGNIYWKLHVSDAENLFSGDIVCGIGHLTSFFPEKLMNRNKGFRVEGLRCYWVEDELVFKIGDEDCDAIYNELHNIKEDSPSSDLGAFAVYPNPANGVLFVQSLRATSLQAEQQYRIANLIGQTLLQGHITNETQQINIEKLPAGMYFISVGNTTQKFVVQ